jgi:hypothetical protein
MLMIDNRFRIDVGVWTLAVSNGFNSSTPTVLVEPEVLLLSPNESFLRINPRADGFFFNGDSFLGLRSLV